MDSSVQDVRRKRNETPDIAEQNDDDTDDGGGSGMPSLPVPSISRGQAILAGVLVAALVAAYLYKQQQSTADFDLGEIEQSVSSSDGGEEEQAAESDGEDIEIEAGGGDPLAGDEQVTRVLKERGRIEGDR